MISVCKRALGLILVTAACIETAATPYLPAKGSAWRLVTADVNNDGVNELVYSARDGAIRCIDSSDGGLMWEVPLGGFAYELRCGDINGDGKPEFIAPCTDGKLVAVSHKGDVLWTFQAELQLMDAVIARPRENRDAVIICGGFDGKIYMLDSKGELLSTEPAPEHCVTRLAVGNLDGKGGDELVVIDRRIKMAIYDINRRSISLNEMHPLTSGRHNWENPSGQFNVFSVRCADINEDGKDEIILGESLWIRQAAMALDGDGDRLWLTSGIGSRNPGEAYYSAAFVRPCNFDPSEKGLETLVLSAGNLRVFDSKGRLLEECGNSGLGFSDILIDGSTMWLGSVPNGDETIYRIDLSSKDWKETFQTLERQGLAKKIGEDLDALRASVLAYDGIAPADGPVYDLRLFQTWEYKNHPSVLSWFNKEFEDYPNLEATGMMDFLEDEPARGTDGKTFGGVHTSSRALSQDQILKIIEKNEIDGIPIVLNFAHGTRPQITLETAEEILKAGPKNFRGFICTETEQYPEMVRFYETYFGPLADLCAEYENKTCTSHNKGVWWMSIPSQEKMFDLLFSKDRKKVLSAGVEDSNSRTPEINLMARLGLRQAGLIAHLQNTVVLDLFCATRYHEWEYPNHGHPFFRLLAAQTLLGGDVFHMRSNHLTDEGFTRDGRESTEILFHMLGKGLLMAPRPDQMVGMSTLGIIAHDAPQKWIDEAHNGHSPDKWMRFVDDELINAVIPHNGVTWGYTRTPDHALQAVLFNKKEQFGHIPATPYGPVAIVPVHADRSRITGVKKWLHTDGLYLWEEGGEKLNGKEAAILLRREIEKAAENLPFRPLGDDVFFQTIQMDSDTYRIYAIDPGWLTPKDRNVDVKIQLSGQFKVCDLLSGDEMTVENQRFHFTVPAGCLRILEVVSK